MPFPFVFGDWQAWAGGAGLVVFLLLPPCLRLYCILDISSAFTPIDSTPHLQVVNYGRAFCPVSTTFVCLELQFYLTWATLDVYILYTLELGWSLLFRQCIDSIRLPHSVLGGWWWWGGTLVGDGLVVMAANDRSSIGPNSGGGGH